MAMSRFFRHVAMTPGQARRMFPPATRKAIGEAVSAGERRHRGEVRFAVEAELSTWQLLKGLSPRARAAQVFSKLGVGRTRESTGVLVYVLLADRAVEILADRGIAAKVAEGEWRRIAEGMREAFGKGRFEAGSVAGVEAIAALLARHFPAREGDNPDELPDEPAML